MAVLRTRKALRDLDEIWDYIARDNLVMADRLLDKITAKCQMLERQPLIGEARPDLGSAPEQLAASIRRSR